MKYQDSVISSAASEPDANFEKAEMDSLRRALKFSFTERFFVMTRLMKMVIMLRIVRIAKIAHQIDDKQTL